ncbi:MAG: adenylosuccinate synthetase, partial [Pirellulales bacterium]|nr:adenylosuccinate synthetase [Pirellulales bacterium]
ISHIALTKLDVLSGFEKISVCTAYRYKGRTLKDYPSNNHMLSECEPIYEELDGWNEDISSAKDISELPAQARDYLKAIEEYSGVPLYAVSLGASREKILFLNEIF